MLGHVLSINYYYMNYLRDEFETRIWLKKITPKLIYLISKYIKVKDVSFSISLQVRVIDPVFALKKSAKESSGIYSQWEQDVEFSKHYISLFLKAITKFLIITCKAHFTVSRTKHKGDVCFVWVSCVCMCVCVI